MYWKDGAWVAASGQSPAGIESVSNDAEATINIDPIQTNKVRLDVYVHAQCTSEHGCENYVGLTEVQFLGCEAADPVEKGSGGVVTPAFEANLDVQGIFASQHSAWFLVPSDP
jgi:hypothetical protein